MIQYLHRAQASVTYPALFRIVCKPAHHSLQDVLFISNIQFLHGQQLTESVWWQLPEFFRTRHIAKMCLEEHGGNIVDVVQAIVQRKNPNSNAVLCSDAAL